MTGILISNEIGLLLTCAINAAVLVPAYRLSRRLSSDVMQVLLDTLLLWLSVQYAVVTILGAAGMLSLATIAAGAVLCGATMWLLSARLRAEEPIDADPTPRLQWPIVAAAGLFAAGYVAAFAHSQRFLPPAATDALAYHLPTAVQWLQDRSLTLFETWYWNLANTYSPLAAETFIVWLIAPAGNDVFARFVQVAPLAMIFLAAAQIGAAAGTGRALGALVGAAVVLSRPFLSQSLLIKDDLIMAAFFVTAAAALDPARLRERFGPWRLGLAVGLLVAVKYPALVVLPVLALMIDAPFRAGWRLRQWLLAIGVALVIAGPWFLRNAWLTGNPLFPVDLKIAGLPIFEGIFSVRRSDELKSIGGIWTMITGAYYGIPPWLIVPLAAVWLVGLIVGGRRAMRDPVHRFCLLAAPLGLVAFIVLSPHPEVRYFFPSFIPLFIAAGLAVAALARAWWIQVAGGVAIVIGAMASGFVLDHWQSIAAFATVGLITGSAALLLCWIYIRFPGQRARLTSIFGVCTASLLGLIAFVYWNAYVEQYREASGLVWTQTYGEEAKLWSYVRSQSPADATIAYANTYLIYPLYGFEQTRRLRYAPVRADLPGFTRIPRLGDQIEGYDLPAIVTAVMNENADAAAWLKHLDAMGAGYLLIATHRVSDGPPELRLARSMPQRFQLRYENADGIVYEIRR